LLSASIDTAPRRPCTGAAWELDDGDEKGSARHFHTAVHLLVEDSFHCLSWSFTCNDPSRSHVRSSVVPSFKLCDGQRPDHRMLRTHEKQHQRFRRCSLSLRVVARALEYVVLPLFHIKCRAKCFDGVILARNAGIPLPTDTKKIMNRKILLSILTSCVRIVPNLLRSIRW